MLRQFSEISPGIEVRNGNENTSDASRDCKLSSNVPGDLSLACFADTVFSIRQFGDDWNWASAEFRVRVPHSVAEATDFQERQTVLGETPRNRGCLSMRSRSVPVDGLLQKGIFYEMTALEIIEKARELPEDERIKIVNTISKELSDVSDPLLTEDEECRVESVLLERSHGPFEQPTKSEFDARVGAEIARLGNQQNG